MKKRKHYIVEVSDDDGATWQSDGLADTPTEAREQARDFLKYHTSVWRAHIVTYTETRSEEIKR